MNRREFFKKIFTLAGVAVSAKIIPDTPNLSINGSETMLIVDELPSMSSYFELGVQSGGTPVFDRSLFKESYLRGSHILKEIDSCFLSTNEDAETYTIMGEE